LLTLALLPGRLGIVAAWVFNLWGSADILHANYEGIHLAGIMQRFDRYTAQALRWRDPFLFSRDCRRGASSPATSQRAGWRRFAG
jgi:hypothetical protein